MNRVTKSIWDAFNSNPKTVAKSLGITLSKLTKRIASIQRELVNSFYGEGSNVYLIDTRRAFWDAFEEGRTGLWSDIVHPGREGSWVIAREILDFFGLNPPYENPYN